MRGTQHLSTYVGARRLANSGTSNVTLLNSSSISTLNLTNITFLVLLGAVDAGTNYKVVVQGSPLGDGSDWEDSEAQVPFDGDDDNKMVQIDLSRFHNYKALRVQIQGTDGDETAVVNGVVALTYNGRDIPPTTHSTLVDDPLVVRSPEAE